MDKSADKRKLFVKVGKKRRNLTMEGIKGIKGIKFGNSDRYQQTYETP